MLLAVVAPACRAHETRRADDGDTRRRLEAVIADVEAGRQATPLIGEPTPAGDAVVMFLAKRADDRAPRIVSDVTGWGEHVDGTFDVAAGTMARVGQSEWYSLQARVAPRARIEYQIAYAPTDYRTDPHNPRLSEGPQRGGARASEFVMPGYVTPQEFADTPVSPAGETSESVVQSRVRGWSWRVIVHTPPGHRAASRGAARSTTTIPS